MALRAIVSKKEEILRKTCKPVTDFNEKLWELLDDMKETLKAANGLGLAAPQVGIIRRAFLMVTEDGVLEAINPELSDAEGTQRDVEGCLSCPEEWGYVTRPMSCKLKAQDRNGNWYEKDLTAMECRCACHENDHLNGILFLDKMDQRVTFDKK